MRHADNAMFPAARKLLHHVPNKDIQEAVFHMFILDIKYSILCYYIHKTKYKKRVNIKAVLSQSVHT